MVKSIAIGDRGVAMGDRQGFKETIERLHDAVAATYRGDPEPYIELWSRREPLSLFGALGPCKTTWPDIDRTFRWVASRFGDPHMSTDLEVVEVGEDLAYTVGYEQGHMAIDGKQQRVKIRVTQIFRRESDEWRMVHRHGDFAPIDDSPGAATTQSKRERAGDL